MQAITQKIWVKSKDFFLNPDHSNGTFLMFLRATTGLFIIVSLLAISADFGMLHGKYGVLPGDVQNFVSSRYALTFSEMVTYGENLFGFRESTVVVLYFTMYIVFALTLVVGLFTRFSALMCLILYVAITSGPYKYGVDVFITTTLFYLVLFPAGYVKSIDNLIFKKRKPVISYTPYLRALQINLCLIYFFAGLSKAISISWYNGYAIWKTINFADANKLLGLNFDFLAENTYLLAIISISTLLLELFYIVFIWYKKTSMYFMTGVIIMHIGIALVLNLYFFAAFMILLNLSAFYVEQKKLITT